MKRSIRSRIRPPELRRAAPALPNGFTLGNLFFGVFAIIDASRGFFSHAVLYIVLGGLCDAFDGRIARATNTGSRFGEELDSLVDLVSFGLAPTMIIYFSVLSHEGGAWWLLCFLFTACAAIRLARFNVTQAGRPKTHFQGLPSPAAGCTLATYFWFMQTPRPDWHLFGIVWNDAVMNDAVKIVMGGLAVLMISNVPYPAVPKIGVRSWRGIGGLAALVAVVVGIFLYGQAFFFPASIVYVLYGLIKTLVLGLIDRIPTGEMLESEYDEDEAARAEWRGNAISSGRRRRHRNRRRMSPTPGVVSAIDDSHQ